ncbi:zinc finger FYVE domain-containing protein 1 [Copidosoma floridanum]|uniref:zinc finger FYVE domain-containing protein 1 n=1 Tax=Copidosoma floridanum TaxID=29053 RepID=UPI0006C94E8D|nr:zinc finger FYVE domain-containing protein 1 [Copidosoma floridanum]
MSGHSSDNSLWKNHKNSTGPAIMESLDSLSILSRDGNTQDYLVTAQDQNSKSLTVHSEHESFLLIDGNEMLKVSSADQFIKRLNCPNKTQKIKVVSIFGNTGDGKSHTLNHAIFKGHPVFETSNTQNSCTLGVWAAFDAHLGVICLDTEGLLGFTENEKVRLRLLLKVLAVSDIIVYRTRSERLHKDMFSFLGDASKAYMNHFQQALQTVGQKEGFQGPVISLGPSVIIFQETMNTMPLVNNGVRSCEDIIRERFAQAELHIEAFSSIKYVGVQTQKLPTNFRSLRGAIKQELRNTTVRSARTPDIVYLTLKNLNDKFSGNIDQNHNVFLDQYFTCTVKCLSCESRCQKSMGHEKPHLCETKCRFQHQYQNQKYTCKKCFLNGVYQEVIKRDIGENESSWFNYAEYLWSGYVLECSTCGEIYRSRKYWIGNSNPEDTATRTEITHVWDEADNSIDTQNKAQRLIDNVSHITEVVSSIAHQPTKALGSWVADQVRPNSWRSNSEITECNKCHKPLTLTDKWHHCRVCGEGFCDTCSSKRRRVRGWSGPVRVCDGCFELDTNSSEEAVPKVVDDVTMRQVSETFVSTLSAVGSVFNYPKSIIKDCSRPSYWVPDAEITNCCVCDVKFIYPTVPLHHCRACGRGVCHNCSQHKKSVPRRNWSDPVRVCDSCIKND